MTPKEITQQALIKWVESGKPLTRIVLNCGVVKTRLEQVMKGNAVISLRGADKIVEFVNKNLQ